MHPRAMWTETHVPSLVSRRTSNFYSVKAKEPTSTKSPEGNGNVELKVQDNRQRQQR